MFGLQLRQNRTQRLHHTWTQLHKNSGTFATNAFYHGQSERVPPNTVSSNPCLGTCQSTRNNNGSYCNTTFCNATTPFPRYMFRDNIPVQNRPWSTAAICVLTGIRYGSSRSTSSTSITCNLRYHFSNSPIPWWTIEVAPGTSCKVFCYNIDLPSHCKFIIHYRTNSFDFANGFSVVFHQSIFRCINMLPINMLHPDETWLCVCCLVSTWRDHWNHNRVDVNWSTAETDNGQCQQVLQQAAMSLAFSQVRYMMALIFWPIYGVCDIDPLSSFSQREWSQEEFLQADHFCFPSCFITQLGLVMSTVTAQECSLSLNQCDTYSGHCWSVKSSSTRNQCQVACTCIKNAHCNPMSCIPFGNYSS